MRSCRPNSTFVRFVNRILCVVLIGISLGGPIRGQPAAGASGLTCTRATAAKGAEMLTLSVSDDSQRLLPARISVRRKGATASAALDPVGRGLDRDYCFYMDGRLQMKLEPATYEVSIRSGFGRVPYEGELTVAPGESCDVIVALKTWFDPTARGWQAAEFHLHSFHPPVKPGDINTRDSVGKMDYGFMALACRAVGWNLVVDNLGHLEPFPAEECKMVEEAVRRPDFILTISSEVRMDPHGHINVPGTRPGIFGRTRVEGPLPLFPIVKQAHQEGGIVVYTHPLKVPFFYWMSATEMPVHIVMEEHGDLFDVGQPSQEPSIVELFGLWNMGVRIGAAATSDHSFARGVTGRRRTYVKSDRLELAPLLKSAKDGATVACNGEIFASLEIDGRGPGSQLPAGDYVATIEAHSLHGIARIDVVADGKIIATIPGDGAVHVRREMPVQLVAGGYVGIIGRDNEGGYSVPTAVFGAGALENDKFYTLFYATNANRQKKKTDGYVLHLTCATNSRERIRTVLIQRNGVTLEEIDAHRLGAGADPGPTSDDAGDYETRWFFWPNGRDARYFNLAFPVDGLGEYQALVRMESGKNVDAGKIRHAGEATDWQSGVAHCWGESGGFRLEMSAQRPRGEVGGEAFRGDWVSTFRITATGLRGADMHAASRPPRGGGRANRN